MIAGRGDDLAVSMLPVDGTYPTGTTQWEKRNIALEIPDWDPDICIQCGKCVMVCPHAVIRTNVVGEAALANAPEEFKSASASWRDMKEDRYVLQISPEDCTGCQLCVEVCPAKDKSRTGHKALDMVDQRPVLERGKNGIGISSNPFLCSEMDSEQVLRVTAPVLPAMVHPPPLHLLPSRK